MDAKAFIRPLLRWWRLIVIVTVLALVASTISTYFQPSIYISRTTLVIGTTYQDPNPDSGQIYVAQQLAQIYADMARREPVRNATMSALGINRLPSYATRVVPNTQIVEITVSDTNPQRAQIIANELANQLMLQSPALSDTETGARQEFITEQLSSLQDQIKETQLKIEELQESLIGLNSASQISNIEKEIAEQTQKLNDLQQGYTNFLANSSQGALNILTVIEPANLPWAPVSKNKFVTIALAGLVGFSLAAGAAYLLEFLDRSLKTASDVDRIFHLPVLGYISEISDDKSRATYVADDPDSEIAENFRMVRSNVEFFSFKNQIKTILVTSPTPGNGKTTVAINLALSISQLEQDVVLVDADFRRGAVHTHLKMKQAPGLADVIANHNSDVDLKSVVRKWHQDETLKVITTGKKPTNITRVVGSKVFTAILSDLKENHELVIIDAPPLIIADTFNLASAVDGVIIVLEPGKTSDEQARAIKEQLDRVNVKVLGCVFNKVSEKRLHSYENYQYNALYSPKQYGAYNMSKPIEPAPESVSTKLVDFFEHGMVPPEVATEIKSAITAIKTQPRIFLDRITGKTAKNPGEKIGENTTEKTDKKQIKKNKRELIEPTNEKIGRKPTRKRTKALDQRD